MPAIESPPSVPRPAAALYDAASQIHREGCTAMRRGQDSAAAFLRGLSLTARRWADAAAA